MSTPGSSERPLIGCCLIDEGESLDRAIEAGLHPTDFRLPLHAKVFMALCEMRTKGTPIGTTTLHIEMGDKLSGQDLLDLSSESTTAHFAHHLRQVREDSRRRALIEAARMEIQDLEAGCDLPEEESTDQAKTAADLHSRRVRISEPPVEPVTRLWLADKPIATPGNIVTLISRAKTGKTATLGAATAAIIDASAGTQALGRDTFKFRASNPKGYAVLVFDTEQSPYDAYLCYKRAIDRSGQSADPEWLHHYSLVGLGAQQLHKALDVALAQAAKAHHGIFCIILDGVADFVASVNDEAECNTFVTWLRSRTVTYECPAICVIHSNEGEKAGDDGRGHLGKQLIRKAESNLLLKKDNDITTITSDKQRKAPITEADQVAFRWSDEAGMHVSCDNSPRKKSGGRTKLHSISEFLDCIPKPGQTPLSGTQLHRFAIQIREIKPNTFKDLLADAAAEGILVRTHDPKTGYAYALAGTPPKPSAPTELPPWDGPAS